MRLKNLLIFTALCMAYFSAFSQNTNPFESIGKQGKVLTLSKGQYEELFDQDSIQQIGTALVNVHQMKVVGLLSEQEAQKRLDNSSNSRFLSVDPLTGSYPELTPYQYASNTPIWAVDIDGLEAGLMWPQNFTEQNYRDTYKGMSRWYNHVDPAVAREYRIANGWTPTTKGDLFFMLVATVGEHMSHSYGGPPTPNPRLRVVTPQHPEVEVHADATKPKLNTTTHEDAPANTNKQSVAANNNAGAAKSNTAAQGAETTSETTANLLAKKRQTLATNNQNSKASEDIVRARLESQLGEDEAILRKPRIYIGDGSSGEWATPDFAVYNTQTGKIRRIVDAKDGGGDLSDPQKKLNQQGGTFRGSSRSKTIKPQAVNPGSVEVERTNVQPSHP